MKDLVKARINAWKYDGEALEATLDFFNDNLELTLSGFADVERLAEAADNRVEMECICARHGN